MPRYLVAAFWLLITFAAPLRAQETLLGTHRYRPGLDFRTLTLEHFDLHFHQGEETLARRLAQVIRDEAPGLEARFGRPAGRVNVILVDQNDTSNGWATVVPYNLIEITAAPPPGRSLIGNTDDWLRMVFVHEYTHVLHLVKSGGWFGSLRRVFGRLPAFYPNLFVPDWQIEGLATFEESARTGHGRVRAGDFRLMLEQAAREERFPRLDRATGATIDWPGGHSPYLFGAYFHQFLADRYGDERLRQLADATARRLPFTGSLAFREVYGRSLGSLWREFQADVERSAKGGLPSVERQRLTTHGFTVGSPVAARDGRIFYTAANPHGFPSINVLSPDGTVERVTDHYHGGRVALAGDDLVFDQLEVPGTVGLVSDLYAYSLRSGRTRALTRNARAADPDVSSAGVIVCTVQRTGRRILATMPLEAEGGSGQPAPLIDEEDTIFSAPRWSPDGRSIVAERRVVGGPSEIVLVDPASRQVRRLAATSRGRHITPTWLPDGSGILFSSDSGERELGLYVLTFADGSVRRVEAAGPGAQQAVVAPDGDRLIFVGYSADGFDLFTAPFDRARLAGQRVIALPGVETDARPAAGAPALETRPYSPFATLLPRFWLPYAETDGDDTVIGAATAGSDVLGRHAYTVTAGWAVPRNRADLQFDYTYSRWRPLLFVSASDETDALRRGHVRARELNAGALLPFRRVRWGASLLASASLSQDDFEGASADATERPDVRRDALRFGGAFSNARAYGYSIGPEEGAAINLVTEVARGGPSGQTGSATSVAGSVRAYQRVWPAHAVIAGRAAGATSRGDAQVRREFTGGGSGPAGGGFDIGVDAVGLLRGFEEADLFGRSVAIFNADYRVPLARPQRGLGTLPVFLRTVHGALFLDLGRTWETRGATNRWRRSAGAELSFDTVLGAFVPMTIATGVAWRHDPSGLRSDVALFARIGRAF